MREVAYPQIAMLRAVPLLVGHPKLDRPYRHLGIEISRDLEIAGRQKCTFLNFDGGTHRVGRSLPAKNERS